MSIAVWIILGIAVGFIGACIGFLRLSVGALRVDRSDPDGPFMFLELKKSVEHVTSKKYVMLKVEDRDYIPHE